MRAKLYFLFLFISLGMGFLPSTKLRLAERPKIDSPQAGEALQGVVNVMGTTDINGFVSFETAFSYDQEGSSWYILSQSKDPVRNGSLGSWDTTTITDGTYRLRVTVHLADGGAAETIVSGLRVRNYSEIETNTPAPMVAQDTVVATTQVAVVTRTPRPSATPLPVNPAEVTGVGLAFSAVQGAGLVMVAFVALGLYTGLRAWRRRSGRRRR